jgi:hypothetical protein
MADSWYDLSTTTWLLRLHTALYTGGGGVGGGGVGVGWGTGVERVSCVLARFQMGTGQKGHVWVHNRAVCACFAFVPASHAGGATAR